MFARLLPLALVVAGCASSSPSDAGIPPPTPLRMSVEAFNRYFAVAVESAADNILQRDISPSVNRTTVFWKMRSIPSCRAFLLLGDDQAALLGMWMISHRLAQFFAEGEGKDLFGAASPIAVGASREIEARIETLAKEFLTAGRFELAQKNITQFVTDHPISTRFEPHVDEKRSWDGVVSTTLNKPVSVVTTPLSFMNPTSGLSDTAAALHRVAATVESLKTELDYAPANIRWQTDLLVLELDESKAVMQALGGLDEIGKSSASIAATAASLPADLREQSSKLLDDVNAKQAGLQLTLDKVQAVLAEARTTADGIDQTFGKVDALVASTDTASQSLTRMAEALTVAIDAFTKLMTVLNAPSTETVPPERQAPPFNINDFGRTADKLTETMKSLGEVLVQVRDLTKPEQTRAIVDTADTAVESVLNRIFLGAGLFVLLVAAVALGYRWFSTRITPRPVR